MASGSRPTYQSSKSSFPWIKGIMISETTERCFNRTCNVGPAPSFKGTPTASPTTHPLPSRGHFFALLQALPDVSNITASIAALPIQPERRPMTDRGPTKKPRIRGVNTAIMPGAITAFATARVRVATVSDSTSPDASTDSFVCLSLDISHAALSTESKINAANTYGKLVPTRKPPKRIGSSTDKSTCTSCAASNLAVAKSTRPESTADAAKNPFPTAETELPSASSASVLTRTCDEKSDISARHRELAETGAKRTTESAIPHVPSNPTAARATPYSSASAAQATMATASTIMGNIVLIIPTPRPWMMTVAGPVVLRCTMDLAGPQAEEVKYSVPFPMNTPAQ
mmetsp:Transcript_31791/g.84891  ORF Transcript_31791/g.84891 Transcript_31791/m.84891 type:complete len:343 (+) Transcript_31791:694-1722(+)